MDQGEKYQVYEVSYCPTRVRLASIFTLLYAVPLQCTIDTTSKLSTVTSSTSLQLARASAASNYGSHFACAFHHSHSPLNSCG
eukprot:3900876-Pyramimonas_sp.AAC.1